MTGRNGSDAVLNEFVERTTTPLDWLLTTV